MELHLSIFGCYHMCMHVCNKVLFREDYTVDDLIDVIEGNRKYVRCLYVYNKIDTLSIEEVCYLKCKKTLSKDELILRWMSWPASQTVW